MNYIDKMGQIQTKMDFVEFLEALIDELRTNPDKWKNSSLEHFLEAAKCWTEDMEGYYVNIGEPVPNNINWKVFANILAAARIYE